MKINKKISILFIFLIAIFLFENKSFAGTQKWNALDYDVTVNEDGSMNVIETWDVYVSETNTLFKDFELDSFKFGEITDVKVTKIDDNKERSLEQIYEEQYHVDPNCYYGLKKSSNTFEIAWNAGFDNTSGNAVYKIYYKVTDAVKVYKDCTEVYWMFLSRDNGMSGKNVTGTVRIPNGLSDIEKLRVWAHGSLSGEVSRDTTSQVSFKLDKIHSNEMLEIRVVTEENIYELPANKSAMLQEILDEEENWANDANASRKRAIILVVAYCALNIVILYLFIKKYNKYKLIKEEILSHPFYKPDITYFRDIPDEKNATPARALFMKNFEKTRPSVGTGAVYTATLLDLVLKGYIELEPIDKSHTKIKILKTDITELSEDEKIIFKIVNTVQEKNGNSTEITNTDIEKYWKREYEKFNSYMKDLSSKVSEYQESKINSENEKLYSKYITKLVINVVIIIFGVACSGIILIIPAVLMGLIISHVGILNITKAIEVLTEKGYEEKMQWNGLKKYMEEFSLLKEREVPDLVLWEKYLVYATAFGIADKVIKQLKIVYPQMQDESMYAGNNYRLLRYATNDSFGGISNLQSTLEKTYRAADNAYRAAHSSSSSGSGGGGGFSSGGGGGGGGGSCGGR